jgi:hypothetical protein
VFICIDPMMISGSWGLKRHASMVQKFTGLMGLEINEEKRGSVNIGKSADFKGTPSFNFSSKRRCSLGLSEVGLQQPAASALTKT